MKNQQVGIKNIRIAYMGTPEISAIVLEYLIKNKFNLQALFTTPDKKSGRGSKLTKSSTKIIAEKYSISIFQPKNKIEMGAMIKKADPELILVFAYGMFLTSEVLEYPKFGALNIHPSLLPKYRGSSPIQSTILNGDDETGVSIIKMTDKMDAGPIIAQEKMAISSEDTSETLGLKLANLAKEIIEDALEKWIESRGAKEQNENEVTFTKMIKKEDGRIDWRKSAAEIENQIKAFTPWPSSFTFWGKDEKKLVKILEAKTEKIDYAKKPGEVFANEKNIFIGTGEGALKIIKIQPEGKNPMTIEEFIAGHPGFVGSFLY